MQPEINYFAYCSDKNYGKNNFIVPSTFLEPSPKAINSKPGNASETLEPGSWRAVIKSAWHQSFEVDSDDGTFLDQKLKTHTDFKRLRTEAEYKDCVVLATASSVQELQRLIKMKDIEESRKRRYDVSDASGGQQHDEPQQQKKKIRSSQSNQQTSNKDYPTASISSEKSYSATTSPTNEKPEKEKSLGYFEIAEKDGTVSKPKAENVCVLVINCLLKNCSKCEENGVGYCTNKPNECTQQVEDETDVDKLRTSFLTNRNCKFHKSSPDKKEKLLKLLGDDDELLKCFESQDDVPNVFVLFILAHGNEDGWIQINEKEDFTTDEVFDSLKKLKKFDDCLKIVNFGPCRGELEDSKYDINNSYEKDGNKNSCRITNLPGMHNLVVFYSTVETTTARGDENGSYFVRSICTCLDALNNDEPLLKFFTIVQNRMHETLRFFWTDKENTDLGQTPELKMFTQKRKFIISKSNITGIPIGNTDEIRRDKIKDDLCFSWESDEKKAIRGRRGFILFETSEQVQEMRRALENLDFVVSSMNLKNLKGQTNGSDKKKKEVFNLEPDVGCILISIFGHVCENGEKEVCVRVGRETHPIKDILYSLVGPDNKKLIGKPKILFVVNVKQQQTLNIPYKKDLQVSATNHSGWLVLILKYEGAAKELIELLKNIGEKSLQEHLEPLLTRESNRKNEVLLNSTLQYLVKFTILPRIFVKPDFKFKKTKISHYQISKGTTESCNEEKIDFDTLLEKAIQSFEENKKSFANRQENPQTSSESSLESNPVRDSTKRESADTSIVWLFNSVAGAGKSTVLEEMRYQLTKFREGFKILLIPLNENCQILREIDTNKVDEIEFLAKTTCNSHDVINNWIKKGELIVFLDGFDKVCSDFKGYIFKILIQLNKARVPLFIGTRPHEVHHVQDRIKNPTIVEIEPLDEAKQIDLLQIISKKQQQDIESSRKKFKDQDILGNPLYLKLWAESSGDGNLYRIFDKIVWRLVKEGLEKENEGKEVAEKEIRRILKVIQLMASSFVRAIDQGSVAEEDLKKINAVGVVTYCNDKVNFTHQTFPAFLTAQKFIDELKDKKDEVPLFDDELVQCRKFVDLFFSTEKGKEESYVKAFVDKAKSTEPLKLVRQICQENLTQMFKLLNPDLSQKDEDGKNALHFALRDLEMVEMVHEKNSKLATDITNNGENCLHLAISDEKCSEEVALWLLNIIEEDENAKTKLDHSALLLMAGEKHKWEVAKKLLRSTDEVNKQDRTKKTILHYAVLSNNIDLVQGLLDRGSDVTLRDDSGATALHIAAGWSNKPEIVDILLKKWRELQEQHDSLDQPSASTQLQPPADRTTTDRVSGAGVDSHDNENRTALHYAAQNNQSAEVVHKLLDKKADIDSQDRKGITALHLAAGWNKNPAILDILLKNGAKVNAQDNAKCTALHFAAKNNQEAEIVRTLLVNGADVDSQDQEGYTALHLAARWDANPEIVKTLLGKDAKVNAKDNYGWTALHWAARYNPAPEVVHALLDKKGCEINVENPDGETALFLALIYNTKKEVAQKLLDNGAKVNEHIWNDKDCCDELRRLKINPEILRRLK